MTYPALNAHLKPASTYTVQRAKLPRAPNCEACGVAGMVASPDLPRGRWNVVWHHHDYAKPLDVIPLCCSCHYMVHAGRIDEPRTGRRYGGAQ